MRSTFSTAIEIAGLGLVAFGFYLLVPWLGIVAAGAALVLVGSGVSVGGDK